MTPHSFPEGEVVRCVRCGCLRSWVVFSSTGSAVERQPGLWVYNRPGAAFPGSAFADCDLEVVRSALES